MRDSISSCWMTAYLQEQSFIDEDLLMDDGFKRRFLFCLCISLAATFVCEMIRRRMGKERSEDSFFDTNDLQKNRINELL